MPLATLCVAQFESRPDQSVIAGLKSAGFRWDGERWTKWGLPGVPEAASADGYFIAPIQLSPVDRHSDPAVTASKDAVIKAKYQDGLEEMRRELGQQAYRLWISGGAFWSAVPLPGSVLANTSTFAGVCRGK